MDHYTSEQTAQLSNYHFAFLELEFNEHVFIIRLARENKKNALHPQMVVELAFAMNHAHHNKDVWAVVIEAKGNVFCAGADLKAFAGFIEPNDSTVPAANGEVLIGELFNKVHKPTIAKVTGDVYAGGFFFLGGCNYVVAVDGLKLGLLEVKRGLYPFQVMASLLRVMPARKVIDWCIRGYMMPCEQAHAYGLLTHLTTREEIDGVVQGIIDDLKQNSPSAIRLGLEAYDKISPNASEHKYLYEMLQKTIGTKDGSEGLTAFREKRPPVWTGE